MTFNAEITNEAKGVKQKLDNIGVEFIPDDWRVTIMDYLENLADTLGRKRA